MKFEIGQELYYVNPFVFIIEKVIISHIDNEYYWDTEGAVLEEKDLFFDLGSAKLHALCYLETFYHNKIEEIHNIDPDINEEVEG